MSRTAWTLLAEHAFLVGFPADTVELVARGAELVSFQPGVLLFREGRPADAAYFVTAGQVAIEVHTPHGGPVVIETIGAGRLVGLSWAAPPFRYQFDARAIDEVEAVAVDAAALRVALAENPVAGFSFLNSLAAVMLDRLQATRLRLLDLYGTGDAR